MKSKNLKLDSKLIHAGSMEDQFLSVNVPIYQTSTFAFKNADHGAACFAGEEGGYIYTRIGNPTINALENCVAELEDGYKGIATSSGMACVNVIYFGLLNQGDHMVSTDAVYGPSRVVMETHYRRFGVESTYVDTSDIRNIEKAIKPNTKLLYLETPSNPTMGITDLKACCELAHQSGVLVAVDNTFATPYLQRPLEYGADIVFHSLTKFLNGHADIVGGMLVTKTREVYDKLRVIMVNLGFNMDPHQAYMVLRGIKTLGVRMERAQKNAMKIAEYLEKHPKVQWVKYPGLKSHPQYELAVRQMSGFGAMISFELKGGLKAGKILMDNVHVATLAVSLGGVETLIQHPASMTHAKMQPDSRLKAGITEGLVRYSTGIEDVDDLIEDLEQALGKI
jgi:methionine-gamma-lyase